MGGIPDGCDQVPPNRVSGRVKAFHAAGALRAEGAWAWNGAARRAMVQARLRKRFNGKKTGPAARFVGVDRGDFRLLVDFAPALHKFHSFGLHAFSRGLGLGDAPGGGVVADVLGDLHGTEVRTAHGAEVGDLTIQLGRVSSLEGRLVRIEAQVELVVPAELVAGFGARCRGSARRVALARSAAWAASLRVMPSFTSFLSGRPRCSLG